MIGDTPSRPGGKRYTGEALVLFPSLIVSMVLCGACHSLAFERLARTGLACIPFKRLHTFFTPWRPPRSGRLHQ